MSDSLHGNPSKSIQWFLEHLKTEQPGAGIAQATARIMGYRWPDESARAYTAIGAAIKAGRTTRELIDALPETANASVFLEHFREVDDAVDQLQRVADDNSFQVQHVVNLIHETGWHALKTAPIVLQPYFPVGLIPDDTIKSLLDRVHSLIDAVTDSSELAIEQRKLIISKLRRVEEALVDFKLRGSEGVEQATDELIGSIKRTPSVWLSLKSDNTRRSLRELITGLAAALSITASTLAIEAHTSTPPAQNSIIIDISNALQLPPTDAESGKAP
jgi:hypothetical protein